jgi:predicted nucleotidyltransferase
MESIRNIVRNVLQHEDIIKLCILYDSAASGRLTDRSDIDIAAAGKNKLYPGYNNILLTCANTYVTLPIRGIL